MKYQIIWLAVATIAMAAAPSFAAEGEKGDKAGRGKDPERRQRVLDEFDVDGDGKLSEDERAAAREQMMQRRGQAGPGQAGPGGRGPGQRGPGGGPMASMFGDPQQAFASLDANGDGVLSQSEFQGLVQRMQEARERMRGQLGQRRGQRGPGAGPGRGAGRRPGGRPAADDGQNS